MPATLQYSGMPRSGSQWLHRLLWNLHESGDIRVVNAHNHNHYFQFKVTGKSPLIGIYRDIRDVIVSAYFLNERRKEHGKEAHPWINELTEGKEPAEAIHAMCEDPHHKVLKSYYDWYMSFAGEPYVMLLRYENVTQEKYAVFDALCGMGFRVWRSRYDRAWEANSLKRLRKAFPEHYRPWATKARWQEILAPETVQLIERSCAPFFHLTGYPTVSAPETMAS